MQTLKQKLWTCGILIGFLLVLLGCAWGLATGLDMVIHDIIRDIKS